MCRPVTINLYLKHFRFFGRKYCLLSTMNKLLVMVREDRLFLIAKGMVQEYVLVQLCGLVFQSPKIFQKNFCLTDELQNRETSERQRLSEYLSKLYQYRSFCPYYVKQNLSAE